VDRLHTYLDEELMVTDMSVIHSNKSQNYRLRSIEDFDKGVRYLTSSPNCSMPYDTTEMKKRQNRREHFMKRKQRIIGKNRQRRNIEEN